MMKKDSKFDPQKHHRKSIRLKNFDYAQPGGYFITIVTYQRALLFGKIINQEMQLNDYGKIADECWLAIPERFHNVELGAHIIMPNHVHGIIVIRDHKKQNPTKLPLTATWGKTGIRWCHHWIIQIRGYPANRS
jgi:putative transposase